MYTFTPNQLEEIQFVMEVNHEFGPRAAFRFFHKLAEGTAIPTEDVEDFIIAFMTQYNRVHPNTY
jgi:hypothetical protein